MEKKTVLIIMDGFGLAPKGPGNAITSAKTPNLDRLFAENPSTSLSASGLDVGLPEGQMGNSEVGHTNIGAGRVVFQDLPKITKDIEDGGFYTNPAYVKALDDAKTPAMPSMFWDYCPTAVFTAILSTSSRCSTWQRAGAWRTSISTAFLTGVMCPLQWCGLCEATR